MIQKSDIFIFLLTVFIAITFTSAGIFLSDELSPANQLYQLYHGEQITYHSYHYGIYENGSVNNAISGANYVMPYSLELPILSLPIYTVFHYIPNASRAVPLICWVLILIFLISCITQNKKIIYAIGALAIITNLILYTSFGTSNIEVLAIVLTNISLYGLFGVIVLKTINETFTVDGKYHWVLWILVMSCSSLLFWVGTLKDHILVALLFMIILYSMIKLHQTFKPFYLIYTSIASGLIIWTRPELSIIIIPMLILYIFYMYKENFIIPLIECWIITGISLSPALVNNFFVTGSIIKFPFQAVNQTMGGIHFSNNMYGVLFNEVPTYIVKNLSSITSYNIFGILFSPANGGVGIIPILLLSTIVIIVCLIKYKNIKLTFEEKLLYTSSIAVILMYLFTSYLGFGMHTEQGMLPDMRYFSVVYAPITLASLSIITRTYQFNYNSIFKKYIISIGIMLILFTVLLFLFKLANVIIDIVGLLLLVISIGIIIDFIRNRNISGLTNILVISAALPAVWQIFISVITNKMYIYPMFVPVVNYIKMLIFP